MRRSAHPALVAGVIAAVGLAAAAATLSRHGAPDRLAPATGAGITRAAPAPSSPAAPEPAVTPAASNPTPISTSAAGSDRPASGPAPSVRPPMTAGMVVAVDPETGELGIPAPGQLGQELSIDEAQDYARQIARELVTEHRLDGSSSLKHDGRLVDYTVVRISPDGKLVFQCVHGEHAVQEALRNDEPVPPALEEE